MTATLKTKFVPASTREFFDGTLKYKYRHIGMYRGSYKAPRPCPYTGWVEKLYSPKYSDPARTYVARKEEERRLQRELIFNLRLCIAMIVFMAILTYVFN